MAKNSPASSSCQRISRKQQQALNSSDGAITGGRGRNGRGHSGKLAHLFDLPMDVFFEILSHLPPLDILRLARTSLEFRKMLMSRTSRHIWIASRRNVVPPLPECPNGLSEPQYASLLFERTCQSCGATRSMNVDYAAFVRLCNNCWMARVKGIGVLAYNSGLHFDADFLKLVFTLLPAAPYEVYKPFPRMVGARLTIAQHGHMFYHEPEFNSLADEYRKLSSGASTASMKQFLIGRRTDTLVRTAFSNKILDWEDQTRVLRGEDLKQAKCERRTAIEEKLRDLGFEPEDFPSHNKEFDKILDQPRNLAPRIWNNIRPKLLELLKIERDRRETAAFNQAWSNRLYGIGQHYREFLDSRRDLDVWERMIFPSFDEVVKIPAVTNLLLSDQANEQVSREQFAAIEPEIIVDVADAMARVRRKLATLLRSESVKDTASNWIAATEKPSTLAPGNNCKGKGKARANSLDRPGVADNNTGDDVEADKALLEQLSSLFICEHPPCKLSQSQGRPVLMSFFGVLEHQSLYSATHGTCDDIAVAVADPTWYRQMPDLLDAIDLLPDSKLSTVRERILSGMARCPGCTMVPGPGMGLGAAEGALLSNMLKHVSGPTGVAMTTMQPVYGRHHITFDPSPQMPQHLHLGGLLSAGHLLGEALPLVGHTAGYRPGLLPWQNFGIASVGIPPIIHPFVYGGGLTPRPGPSRLL